MLICVQWRCEVTYLWLNGTSSSPARPSTEPSYVRQSQSRRGSPDGFTSPTIPAASSPPPVHLVPPSNPRNCCFPPLLHRHSHRAGTITQSSQVAPPSRSASRKVISSGGGGGGGESSCCSCCSCCCARSASLKCSGPGERDCPAWTAGQREREREREEETLGPARDCVFFCVCCRFYSWLQWGGHHWSKPRLLQAVLTLHSTAGARGSICCARVGRIPEMPHSSTHHPRPGYQDGREGRVRGWSI